ncbi:hypothetical protein AJ87_05915 [Rhizobium yanglingense]|nr:hypothetical protein AJ87_05915 [Rhizobium yanglingense]
MAKILVWLTIALAAVAVGLGVMLAISWGNIDKLEAEKAVIQRELDETAADLKVSTDNHNRMLSEKNRMLAAERERAAAEQSAAVESARIAKDIEYATDGTNCRDSDPMQRVCAACGTQNIVKVPEASIRYQTQDDPEAQLVCPEPPAAINPDTATDRQVASYVLGLRDGYGTCYRSVQTYKTYRRGIANDANEFDPRMHQQMGEVLAEIRNLRDAFRQSEIKSDSSRATMHQRMDMLVDRVGKVEGTVVAVQEDISEMRPVTDDVKRWKLMGIGALAVIGIGGMAMGVTFADAIRRISAIVLGR